MCCVVLKETVDKKFLKTYSYQLKIEKGASKMLSEYMLKYSDNDVLLSEIRLEVSNSIKQQKVLERILKYITREESPKKINKLMNKLEKLMLDRMKLKENRSFSVDE